MHGQSWVNDSIYFSEQETLPFPPIFIQGEIAISTFFGRVRFGSNQINQRNAAYVSVYAHACVTAVLAWGGFGPYSVLRVLVMVLECLNPCIHLCSHGLDITVGFQ